MKLIVYSNGSCAGMLDMADGEPFYGFTYDIAYLAARQPALSLSLPLQEQRFDGAHTLPFFEGLLPEGDTRTSVTRQLGIPEHSPAKLLKALGKDCAGDVAVLEEDDPYRPPADDAYAPLKHGLGDIAKNPFGEISQLRARNRLSLAGGQEKIALYHDCRKPLPFGWYVPLKGSPSTHIVKPQVSDAYPQLAYNEFLCMTLAALSGIEVAKVGLVVHDRPLLVIDRFDRVGTEKTCNNGMPVYRRVRQEDFCQALGCRSSRKYEHDGGPGFADMCNVLLRHSVRFLHDRQALTTLLLFNYFIGNCDAHAKNYALLLGATGTVKLAPAYDLVSTTVYDGRFGAELSRGMGMRIGAHTNIDRITREDFKMLARDIGMPFEELEKTAGKLGASLLASFDAAAKMLQARTADDVGELALKVRLGIEKRFGLFA